jgi:hypothetical protein
MSGLRGIDIARRATVRICDQHRVHRGQGLLLDMGEAGTFVLTCHHVIAPLAANELYVQLRQDDGQLSEPILAQYEAKWSRPSQDVW